VASGCGVSDTRSETSREYGVGARCDEPGFGILTHRPADDYTKDLSVYPVDGAGYALFEVPSDMHEYTV